MFRRFGNIFRMITGCVALLTVISCSEQRNETQIRSVKVTSPRAREVGYVRNYPAVVKTDESGLGFKTPGQISHIYVKEGDYVRQGQLLATLDAADYQLGVNAVQAQYDQLKKECERLQKMVESRGVSQNEYEKALAGLDQLATQLQVNKNKLSYTRLYAPYSGYIQEVNFSKAEMVDAGTQVFSILDDGVMKIEFDVPVGESEVADASARYTLSYNGSQEEIPVRYISKSVRTDGNQLHTVRLGVDRRRSSGLTPGMNATVHVLVPADDKVATGSYNLPLSSVVSKDGKTWVWVLASDTTVRLKEVRLGGVDKNGMAIIESGVSPNERIISAGVNSLHEGEKVKVIEPGSETNVGGQI